MIDKVNISSNSVLTLETFLNLIKQMKEKEQVIFDIQSEKFKYLVRGKNKTKNVVNIDVLNARLNRVKKLNIYSNTKMIFLSIVTVIIFVLISHYF